MRNIVSGNANGVVISDTGTSGNVIAGNYIGTGLTGESALPNANDGVRIIGGTPPITPSVAPPRARAI